MSAGARIAKGFGIVAACVGMLAAGTQAAEWRTEWRQTSAIAAELTKRRLLVGSTLPASIGDLFRGDSVRWSPRRPSVILVIGKHACLTCLTELSRWNEIAAQVCTVNVGVIVVGIDTVTAAKLEREESPRIQVLADSDGMAPKALGINLQGSLRLVVVNNQVAIVTDGSDDGTTGFAEGIRAIYGEVDGETVSCGGQAQSEHPSSLTHRSQVDVSPNSRAGEHESNR